MEHLLSLFTCHFSRYFSRTFSLFHFSRPTLFSFFFQKYEKLAKEQANNDNNQLVFLITDALGCTPESLMQLKKMTRSQHNCLFVLIIIDTGVKSILDLKRIEFDAKRYVVH